jgi:predicted Holliday junction resolvase-like endonuclease
MIDTVIIIAITAVLLIIAAYWIGKKQGSLTRDRHWESQVPDIRNDAITRSRAVLGGQFSEQLAPYFPNFPYSPTECRFIGKPIDFLVFKGMDNKKIEEVIFVEVKSGNAKLSEQEKNLKHAIEQNKITWEEYRIPSEATKEKLDD